MGEQTISIRSLSVSYGKKTVLSNISIDLESGQLYGLLGPNGAGKSTLFKSILGLIDVSSGTIKVLGGDIEDVRKKVVYIPQRGDIDWQFPATVTDVVLMGRYPHLGLFQRISKKDKAIAMEALEKVGMTEFQNRQIGQLSGGQQQRVFIARALCQQADIFLFDEPFAGVDITTEKQIVEILKDMADENKTLIIIHHDLSKVTAYFDKIMLLNQWLVAHGDTKETFTERNIAKAYGGRLTILQKTETL